MERKIVTLGASAGGLAALEAFFKTVPEDPDCSFVIVQHLSPDFKSLMSQLLTAYTKLPIREVDSGLQIANNHIYLIPAGCLMRIADRKFELYPRNVEQMPINIFMESAAKDFGDCSVGVVLSGTGTDGTRGCKAIREVGGLIITQDPISAEFPSMPENVMRQSLSHYTLRSQSMWPIIE